VIDLSNLNEPQREAVLHGDGPLVVFAGAGSGKTRVITTRIARLVRDGGVDPASILAVTFTNKAAGEMRERLAPMLGYAAKRLFVGTFHSTSARILREIAPSIGRKKDFVIYDEQDKQAMLKRILRDFDIDDKATPAKTISHRIDSAKNQMQGPDSLAGRDPSLPAIRRVYEAYEERMAAANALDFGDLIYRLVLALESDDVLRRDLSSRFRYVLVDEFQDTNHAQLRLVEALCATHRNLCVVGDDDQSIYRWRGAERRNILDFRSHFGDAHIVKLEQNYRSSQRILAVAHEVIRRSNEREPKRLWTENPDGEPVLVVRAADERDEAEMVVRGVRQLAADGEPLAEVAIFYRTHAQSRVFEELLRSHAIPYRVVGGMRFFERAEVKDLLGYLRLLLNPTDDVSCLRIVNVPARGIGKTTIDKLTAEATRRGISVFAAMRELVASSELPKAAQAKVDGFIALIDGLRRDIAEGGSVAVVARDIIERTGYEAMLRADDSPESDARLENLGELVGSIAEYEANEEVPTLAGYLERVTLDTGDEDADANERVTLMTVHAAKGLEFDVVMVTGLEEGMFPYGGFQSMALDPEELDEERRLAYVAFTRARKRLVLSWASVRRVFGQSRAGFESRFLREVDALTRTIETPRAVAEKRSFGSSSYGGGGYARRSGGGSYGGGSYGGGSYGGGSFGDSSRGSSFGRSTDPDDAVDEAYDHTVPPPRTTTPRPSGSYVDTSDGDLGSTANLRVSSRVSHPKFGAGVVLRVIGGLPPKVVVRFATVGEKTVVATYLSAG